MTDAAPIIVTALFGGEDQAWFDRQRKTFFPPDRNHLTAHLTLFHHLPPTLLPELKQRLAGETRGVAAPSARIAGLMDLGGGVAYRIESCALQNIRDSLADAFAPLLTPQDAGGWRAHVTVQNKVAPKEARALKARLEAEFTARPVVIAGLAAFYYRGGPWEAISRHMFA
ncbi:2'-5' RNA ligase family protein [Stakelama sp. CBK3Z-3]|uniref:2'-5' RNA ligase family protein n=1 Tax=Stakelama flava TaxID=2860338 RepID=A0ABS6XH61_9SPHN|nr:2'-5' RNA ligase family protein [Stakelama flava]MBW4329543.1 2'-5' RNA ligase family protein [Stakelama flava]